MLSQHRRRRAGSTRRGPCPRRRTGDARRQRRATRTRCSGSTAVTSGSGASRSRTSTLGVGRRCRVRILLDLHRPNGVNVFAPRTRFINMVVHNNGDGFGFWRVEPWTPRSTARSPSETVGLRPTAATDTASTHKTPKAESSSRTSSRSRTSETGAKAYSEAGYVRGIRFIGLISANNGAPAATAPDDPVRLNNLLVGSSTPSDDIEITDAVLYQPAGVVGASLRLGFPGQNGRGSSSPGTTSPMVLRTSTRGTGRT